MQSGKISVQTENIFPIIKKFLYSDHEIFLRELVSNAVDATTKLQILSSKGEFSGELGDLTIHINNDETAKTVTISDRGIGMTGEEVEKYLNQVAFSSANDFIEKYKEGSIIGHFGLGFYSAFMVASKVEVRTKSFREDAPGVTWTCEGEPEYTLVENDKTERGTDIILYINDENNEFLTQARLEGLLKKYCRFLPVPIQFGLKEESRWEGEGKDAKEIKETKPNVVNNPTPLWTKQPNSLKDEDYISFYEELYPFSPAPMFWIHLNIDYPFNLTGVLYFPKLSNSFEVQKNKIQLYSNQVYVTDEVKDFVPEFLTLLHGVIDSPDIPLNVSRSYLQSDQNVKKITGYITRKVADKLQDLFKKSREEYASKWDDIGIFIKYGMISDEKFYERAIEFALLKNLEGQSFTIQEYKDKIKEIQKDKHDKLVCLYTSDKTHFNSYVQPVQNKGYDILLMDTPLDNHFMQNLEHKHNDLLFVRIDSDTPDNLIQKEDKTESILSKNQEEKVKTIFEEAMPAQKSNITLKALTSEDLPVMITRPEFLRRMREMQAMQGMHNDTFGDFYNVVVNTNHPMVAEKLLKMKSEDKKTMFAKYLVNLALLNQGLLKGEDLTAFVKQSLELMNN